jgi:uncharacterized repeat protein (TIGR01451 family)
MKSFLSSLRKIDQKTNSQPNSHWSLSTLRQRLITLFGVTVTTVFLLNGLAPAQAEGSKELTANGGNRAYLVYTTNPNFGVPDKTTIYVYAETGENINLGSSANGIGSGKIQYTKPNGSTSISCPISSTTNLTGRIVNRSQELAGPFPSAGGYTPCVITVGTGESGIWKIDFVSPNPTVSSDPSGSISAAASWSSQLTNNTWVTAWDATVIQGTSPKTGRVYTNYFAGDMGNFSNNSFFGIFYVVTYDGYHYKVQANGLDPFRFFFFSDNKGVYTTADNKPSYSSFDLPLPAGKSFKDPNTPDGSGRYTNKLFFNEIDSSMPSSVSSGGTTWLNPSIVTPPPPPSITLVGAEGTPDQVGQGIGGSFNFTNPDTISRPYQITLDLNGDSIFGNSNDRVLLGTAAPGPNSVTWDGKDGLGAVVKSQTTTFKTVVATLGGEVHFPLIDAESNINGLIITRLNGATSGTVASPSFNTDRIYYNDPALSTVNGVTIGMAGNGGSGGGTAPNPRSAIGGVDSNAGAHKWGPSSSTGFGNATIIDTWAYAPEFTPTTLNIVIKGADLQVAKSLVGSLIPSQTATYNIDITNINDPLVGSISNVVGATVQDVLLPVFLNPKVVSCQVITGTGNCGTYAITNNTLNATVDLNSGSKLRFEIQATLSPTATGLISNSATVTRPKDIGDPVNQDTSGGTTNTNEVATDSTNISPKSGNANVLLVKRITAINEVNINTYKDDISSSKAAEDNHANWPTPLNTDSSKGDTTISSFLRGAINAGTVKPGDRIEYTIYFLNSGKLDANGVRICDLITANQSFKNNTYGVGKDIQVQLGNDPTTVLDLTAANDAPTDRAQVYAVNASVPNTCNLKAPNTTSRVVDIGVTGLAGTGLPNLTVLPGSNAAGSPSNSYGFVRFTTIVP